VTGKETCSLCGEPNANVAYFMTGDAEVTFRHSACDKGEPREIFGRTPINAGLNPALQNYTTNREVQKRTHDVRFRRADKMPGHRSKGR